MVPDKAQVIMSQEDLRRMIERELRDVNDRLTNQNVGIAGVCAVFLPGLGHLYLRRYGWFVVFFGAYAGAIYALIASRSVLDDVSVWWVVMFGVWVASLIHAIYTANNQED